MKKYISTVSMAMLQKWNEGFKGMLPCAVLRLLCFLPLMLLWRVILNMGARVDMSMAQMLSYTYLSCLLQDLLNPESPASGWLYEGLIQQLYQRPMSIPGHLVAQTIGGWLPMLLVFSLPMALAAPFAGISLRPASWWFAPSLFCTVLLGFAIDFLFACLTIRLRGMGWLSYVIRSAVVSLFSGAVIPFQLMPAGLSRVFTLQPFGSLGGAALSVFTGTAEPVRTVLVQLFWILTLWPAALLVLRKSRENILSFGG